MNPREPQRTPVHPKFAEKGTQRIVAVFRQLPHISETAIFTNIARIVDETREASEQYMRKSSP